MIPRRRIAQNWTDYKVFCWMTGTFYHFIFSPSQLFSHGLDNEPFSSLTIEFGIKYLLPGT